MSQEGWNKLQKIKQRDQDRVLKAWKNGYLSDGSEYSDEEKQAMIDEFNSSIEFIHVSRYEYDPWVEEMMDDDYSESPEYRQKELVL